VSRITALPDVSERLTALGFDRVAYAPAEFGSWIKAELPRWAKVIADAKIANTV
jgi:tripartite-type tricarboxylate transporter receptor subunit TctC